MRRHLLLLIYYVLFFGAWASPIDKYAAYSKAVAFMSGRGVTMPKNQRMAFAGPSKGTSTETSSYYVFDVGSDKGFVIVAGDDAVPQILGYTDSGSFEYDKLPENAKAMLESYAEQIAIIQQNPSLLATSTSTHEAIAPLVKTEWGQNEPYNYLCPIVASESSRSVTGCVATAMAQVMYYHQWPEATTEDIPIYSYTYNSSTVSVDAQEITEFDWDAMQTTYTGSESESDASAMAVAELMVCAGKSVQMQYTYSGSGAYTNSIIPALKTYFDYHGVMKYIVREDYTTDEWDELIYNELYSTRPVIFSAASGTGVHAFVCDGYDGDGLYHINWGWNGNYNGYFRLALLNPYGEGVDGTEGSLSYSINQNAIIGIQPDQVDYDAESMVLTAYKLETSTSTTSRMNDFTVNLESHNRTGSTATFDMAVGIYNSSGTLIDTHSGSSVIMKDRNYFEDPITFSFGVGYSDGVYYIKPLSRMTGDEEWHPQNNADRYYIVATISGDTVYLENVSPNPELTINSVSINGNRRANSTQKIAVSLTNTGTANSNRLYAFEDGTLLDDIGVNIDPGTSADYTITWIPSSAGTYTITLASDSYMEDVLYTTDTLTIGDAVTVAAELSVAFQVDNADGTVINGTTFSGTATITNEGTSEYYDYIKVGLCRKGFSVESCVDYLIQLPEGSSFDQAFSFTGLDTNEEYYVWVGYYSNGTFFFTGDNHSDIYTFNTSTGIESAGADSASDDSPVYNLQGVRMPNGARLQKGIYIKGGKKFVVR